MMMIWSLKLDNSLLCICVLLWVCPLNMALSYGNLTLGEEHDPFGISEPSSLKWKSGMTSIENYPGVPIMIQCFACSVLFGHSGYYNSNHPGANSDKPSDCVIGSKPCDHNRKCCSSKIAPKICVYKKPDSTVGSCKRDRAKNCDSLYDCEAIGANLYCNLYGRCVKPENCVILNKPCDKNGTDCCLGDALYCHFRPDKPEVGLCKHDYSCKTDEDCYDKGDNWKGQLCNDGNCIKYPCKNKEDCKNQGTSRTGYQCKGGFCANNCAKQGQPCNLRGVSCCTDLTCIIGDIHKDEEGICSKTDRCNTTADCDRKGFHGQLCHEEHKYCYEPCYLQQTCKDPLSYRKACCIAKDKFGRCLNGKCREPYAKAAINEPCREPEDCYGNFISCKYQSGKNYKQCTGCIQVGRDGLDGEAFSYCSRDRDCCGNAECGNYFWKNKCSRPKPACLSGFDYCAFSSKPCCRGKCTLTFADLLVPLWLCE